MIFLQKMKPPAWLIVIGFAVVCLAWQTGQLKVRHIHDYDQILYLPIAHDLATTGVFTDGRFVDLEHHAAGDAGMFIAPLYPTFIAVISKFSLPLTDTIKCTVISSDTEIGNCALNLGILRPIQFILAVITLLLLWQIALQVTGNQISAWIALLATGLFCRDYAEFANVAMTEAIILPLFSAFSLFLIKTIQQQKTPSAIIAGLLLGLCSLARPEYIYLIDGFIILAMLAMALRRHPWAKLAMIIGLTSFAIVVPWIIRNWLLFGKAAITEGYAGLNLAQRAAYQLMTWREWLAGWIFYLPDFGDNLARWLFQANDFTRLDYAGRPDTFYQIGFKVIAPESLKAAGGAAEQVGYLLRNYALPEPFKYMAVTLLLSWRGFWIGKYFALFAAPFLGWFCWKSIKNRNFTGIALLLPPFLLLFLHGAVSNNMPRYNLTLIPAMATAMGAALGPWLQRRWIKYRNRSKLTP